MNTQTPSNPLDTGFTRSFEQTTIMISSPGLLGLLQDVKLSRLAGLFTLATLDGLLQALGVASIMPFVTILADPSLADTSRFFILLRELLPALFADNLLWFTGFFALFVLLLSNAVSILNYWLSLRIFNAYHYRISVRLLSIYLGKEILDFNNRKVSDMSNTILSEVERVVSGTLMAGVGLFADLVVVVSVSVLLLIVNPLATAITVATLGGGYLFVYFFIVREVERLGSAHTEAETRMFSGLSQALALYKDAKVLDKAPFFLEHFARPARDVMRVTNRYEILTFVPAQVIEILTFSLILVVALFLTSNATVAASALGAIAFYAFAAYRLVPVLKSLLDGVETLRYGSNVVEKLLVDLRTDQDTVEDSAAVDCRLSLHDCLVLERLSFHYPGAPNAVFENLDAAIPAGRLTCIVGPSGAGKSTLLDLLLGLIPPTSGRVLVDGAPLHAGNRREWRRLIGYVPQQVGLFDGTLAQNIAFGETQIDQTRVEEAARAAGIHYFVTRQLARGYETPVGDGGHALSSGEMQRIGIARALYRDPPLLLLDEATNELDAATEDLVVEHLLSLPGKTIVFVTHKARLRDQADHLIELTGHD